MKDRRLTRVLADAPLTVETLPKGLGSDPTPLGALFVRNNLGLVEVADPWHVEITGVAAPTRLTLPDIFGSLPRVEVAAVLQCAGNGRSRLRAWAPGVQWDVGGMGCVVWGGVRLGDLVDACGGAADTPAFVTVLGGDANPVDPARVERSVPFDEAVADALVADRVNGQELPAAHGGPARFVMPGFYAVNSVKWVRRIALTHAETDADIQSRRYRMTPPGAEPSPQHLSLWAMEPTSFLLAAKRVDDGVFVGGVAFTGGDPVVSVEVSDDGGARWHPAELVGADRGRFWWRRFEATLGTPGRIVSRAITARSAQRRWSRPNAEGYAVDGWEELAYRGS